MDDHPGLAEEFARASHPTLWSVAHFDWFSDEYTVMGRAATKAEAERLIPQILAASRTMKDKDLVLLAPARMPKADKR